MITSRFPLDSNDNGWRRRMAADVDLVAAIRLPSRTHREGGTTSSPTSGRTPADADRHVGCPGVPHCAPPHTMNGIFVNEMGTDERVHEA